MSFDTVLVANRGEIACRIIRSCRAMGLRTVAVFSDADVDAPHVHAADEAVRVGPAPAAESYLNVDALLAAAARTGAGAIHPGYGFLAERPDFVDAVSAAGLVFVGPDAATVRAMGDKAAARALMSEHGVPVVPGYSGADQDDARFVAEAERVGYPVLVKATAGGGGKGMSVVREPGALMEALAQARRLARSAFGDDRLLLERYVSAPRHVEVQILGDHHGRVVHCFERECSVQRRFQKIIEETPSPALDDPTRAELCAAGVRAGEAIGYVGAGTVEFILDGDGAFYFLEVNTRLQVEHPVTELCCGLDLVREQLRIALGGHAPTQASITPRGHAIECRLYAEDPAADFRPATGRILEWSPPAGLRLDAGVTRGSEVGIDYDPLLAKLVVHAETRDEARLLAVAGLRRLGVQGVTTNRAFLADVLRHPVFAAGEATTHFVAEQLPGWQPAPLDPELVLAAAVFDAEARRAASPLLPALRSGWRNNPFRPSRVAFLDGETRHEVEYETGRDGYSFAGRAVRVVRVEGDALTLDIDGRRRTFHVVADGDRRWVRVGLAQASLVVEARFPEAEADDAGGGCVAPMPGRVVQVLVSVGDEVVAGAPLVVLEAMKMEQTMTAAEGGAVVAVRCAVGDVVDAGAVLVEVG